MGYELEPRTVLLCFEPPYDGIEVRMRLDVPLSRLLPMQRLYAQLQEEIAAPTEDVVRSIVEMFLGMADGWNVTSGGEPVPFTVETLMDTLPATLTLDMIGQWVNTARGGIAAPLEEPSPNGNTSEEPLTQTVG